MTQRRMVRSLLAVLVLTLLAAPAVAAAAEQAAEVPRSGWAIDLGEQVSWAWGLLFGDRVGDGEVRGEPTGPADQGISSMAGEDEGSANLDPDG